MSVQTVSGTPNVEWDDSVVFVFSFTAGSTQFFCGLCTHSSRSPRQSDPLFK